MIVGRAGRGVLLGATLLAVATIALPAPTASNAVPSPIPRADARVVSQKSYRSASAVRSASAGCLRWPGWWARSTALALTRSLAASD